MLSRTELSRNVAEALDVTLRESEAVVEAIIAAMVGGLRRDSRIELRGFGTFWIHERGPRMARNPSTGAPVAVNVKKVVHFRVSKEVKRLLNTQDAP